MKKLSQWIQQRVTGWAALVGLVIFVLFVALVLPRVAETGETAVPTPDTMLTYSASTLYQMAEGLGEEGRASFIRARWTFDVIWPLVYTFFQVTAVTWLARRAFAKESPWQKLNLLPLAAMLFDFLENSATSLVMARYPAETAVIAPLAGILTLIKWLLVGGSSILIIWLAGLALYKRIQK